MFEASRLFKPGRSESEVLINGSTYNMTDFKGEHALEKEIASASDDEVPRNSSIVKVEEIPDPDEGKTDEERAALVCCCYYADCAETRY